MKKKVLSILGVLLISISTLTGCAKCIDKKEESVKVTVVNEYYKPKETRFTGIMNIINLKKPVLQVWLIMFRNFELIMLNMKLR